MESEPKVGEQKLLPLPKDPKRQKVREWRWWKTAPWRLTKLQDAYAVGCNDKEACGYAGISERQLYYYQSFNPDFVGEKEVLKDRVVLAAKQTVASKVKDSYANAMDYLKRRRRMEFGDMQGIDMTSGGKPIPAANAIEFVNFTNAPPNAAGQ